MVRTNKNIWKIIIPPKIIFKFLDLANLLAIEKKAYTNIDFISKKIILRGDEQR